MAYLALARKWRPKSFQEVVGQGHVVKALSNALDSDRVHHAYLFTGTRGVGKTTLARIFAKSLNCETGTSADPCQQCSTCLSVDEGRFVDLIEVDAASRTKVDDTREMLENVHYAPTSGKYKVYLIDEVHMLSGHSFNALLKTLEEPPEHVKFLFATTDPQKLPVTVLSRCLQFNLRAMRPEQIENQLVKILDQENIDYEIPALQALAKAADGSMRDGLSLLDQAIAQSPSGVTQNDVASMLGTIKAEHSQALLNGLVAQDATAVMQVIADMADHAVDFEAALDELLVQLYTISLAQVAPTGLEAKGLDASHYSAIAQALSPETIQLFYQIGLHGKRDITFAPDLRVGFEMALLRMLIFEPSGAPQGDSETADTAPQQKPVPAAMQPAPMQAAPTQVAPLQEQVASAPAPTLTTASSLAAPAVPEATPQAAAPQSTPEAAQVSPSSPSATAPPSATVSAEAPSPPSAAAVAQPSVNALALAEHNEWGAMLEQSTLVGFARELGMNCSCERLLEDRVELALAPRLQHLFKPERITEIEAELTRLSGKPFTVELTVEDSSRETPAECLVRLGVEQTAQLKANIEQQPGVQALMSEFGANIVEQSVKPAK